MGVLERLRALFSNVAHENDQPSPVQTPVEPEKIPTTLPIEQNPPSCIHRYTITSDIGGTIETAELNFNLDLVNFLCDAAEDSNIVILVTGGSLDLGWNIFKAACAEAGRAIPETITIQNKSDFANMEADIAFDDENFDYLKNQCARLYSVTINLFGDPDIPFEEIRKILDLPSQKPTKTQELTLQDRQP